MLKSIGLTDKETEIYIHLSKQGIQKISQISKILNINKGLVYRILKSLEQKGFVDVTLEHPTRYVPIQLEKVIDEYIKLRKQEATNIENVKENLLLDWKKIGKTECDPSLERFSVIEGETKVFHKISQMVKETKEELLSIATIGGLLRAEKFGILDDILNRASKSTIKIRYITSINEENVDSLQQILTKLNSVLSLRGKHSDVNSNQLPRLVLRDKRELLLFIDDKHGMNTNKSSDIVLFTNCKPLIQSFYELFEDVWKKSSNVERIIQRIEKGKPPEIMELMKDPEEAKRIFITSLINSKEEILIVTSSERLVHLTKNIDLLKKCSKKNVEIKIMAPITAQNLQPMQKLLQVCDLHQIPVGYAEMIVIDDDHLFQINSVASSNVNEDLNFENVLYTNEEDYVRKIKNNLLELWEKSNIPPYTSIR